jgi:HlyD family secretion protein
MNNMKKFLKRFTYLIFVVAVVAVLIIAFLPSPLKVEAVRVGRGSMQVSIDEEGETRAHDHFILAAPVAGRLMRIELREGDKVTRGEVVATIMPSPVEPQKREEILARVQNAEALKREADQRVEHARADYEQARREAARAEQLVEQGIVSTQTFEQARNAETTCNQELDAAKFRVAAAASDVRAAKAGLMAIETDQRNSQRAVKLYSPVSGRVLRITEKSERVLPQGAPIIVIGDPKKLEIVVDVLSTDAVKVRPGMAVSVEGWGGERPVEARVRTVEASAFTKVSALGVEEQRVNIIADFVNLPDLLGDGYQVEVRIITWQADNVLKVPVSALFRHGDNWSVFVIEQGKAKRREVEIAHRNQSEVEIGAGLDEGALIVLHPSNEMKDGAQVEVP